MTWDDYLRFIATPENLARATNDAPRIDRSAQMRAWYDSLKLTEYQESALRELAAMPGGPAKMLVISEEWSSDCRRDVPMAARVADTIGFELRIFTRDGQEFESGPTPVASPNGDLMSQFLNHKNGATFQTIPVIAYFTKDLEYLCHHTEYASIYEKDRIVAGHIRVPLPGESADQTRERIDREFGALQQSHYFHIWASAGVDQQISALHRRLMLGNV
jgi:hypothetical protein